MAKILVVDDVGFIRHRITNVLTKAGFTVMAADDGQKGLDLLRQDALISLVLTDGPMRRCSGLDLMRAAQTLERHDDQGVAHTPKVVLMTTPGKLASSSMNDWYHPDRAVSYGFAAVLCKPFTDGDLLKCVRSFWRGPSAMTAPAPRMESTPAPLPTAAPSESKSADSGNQEAYHSLKRLVQEQMTILNTITE
jgi:CheY-like chemotaxis protein